MKRSTLLGQIITLVALGIGVGIAESMPVGYSGAPIVLRQWLAIVSGLVGSSVALGLALSAWGTSSQGARWVWSLGAGLAVVHATVPWWLGSGPWQHGSATIYTLTTLMWLPAAARALGVGLSGLSATGVGRISLLGLGVADLAVVLWLGFGTPVAIIARAHPGQGGWLWLLAAAGSVAVLAIGVQGSGGQQPALEELPSAQVRG